MLHWISHEILDKSRKILGFNFLSSKNKRKKDINSTLYDSTYVPVTVSTLELTFKPVDNVND